jgi:Leucine-rich repeat (LRR) protein
MEDTGNTLENTSHEEEETTNEVDDIELTLSPTVINSATIWPEVKRVFETRRFELTLVGAEISKRIEDANGSLDPNIFRLRHINFLEVAKTKLSVLHSDIGNIRNLTSLLCHSNALTSVPAELGKLVNMKNLDLSNNKLTELPSELENLVELMSVNLGGNQLQALFPLEKLSKLAVLDLNRNKFKRLPDDLGSSSLENLSNVNASFNELTELSENLVELAALKTLNVENNQITHVPAVICQCVKLKDLLMKENKLKDNRLKKLVEQDKGKAIIEYLERVYAEELKTKPKSAVNKSSGGGAKKKNQADSLLVEYDLIKIHHCQSEAMASREILINDNVVELRPHIVCAIVRQLNLDGPNFKKFLAIQVNFEFLFLFASFIFKFNLYILIYDINTDEASR